MDEAFENLGLKGISDFQTDSPEQVAAMDLWNKSWDYAKANKFFVIGESIPTTTSGSIESSSISFVRVSSILHSCGLSPPAVHISKRTELLRNLGSRYFRLRNQPVQSTRRLLHSSRIPQRGSSTHLQEPFQTVIRAGSHPHHIDHCTVRVKVADCVAEPAVPIIVTSYVPVGAVVDVVVFELPPHPTAVEAARIVSAKPSCTYHRLLLFRRRSSVQPRNPPPPKNASAVVPPEPWPGNAG
jgi:hypothetical protein